MYIYNSSKNTTINMKNSTISGWSAVYNKADNLVFNAYNSTFSSENPYIATNDTEASQNSFSTIITSEYYKHNNEDHENNAFTFNDCKIIAKVQNEKSLVSQTAINNRSPMNNVVKLNNTTIDCDEECSIITCFSSNCDARSDIENDGTSKIYKNNVDITFTDKKIFNFIDDFDTQGIEEHLIEYNVCPLEALKEYLGEPKVLGSETYSWTIEEDNENDYTPGTYKLFKTTDGKWKFEKVSEE